ncbi:MAG: Methionine aminopeptidase [Thermoproteota archaeon]|nr:Methionine aminopeptidase [Thermoproteota archaeon]
MLSRDVLECYIKAGKIASEVRSEAKEIVKKGVPLLEICEKVEASIKAKGGELAFPCNICLNEIAAHYSSPPEDAQTVPKNAVVKIDLGVHIDGYIADTAMTVCLNPEFDGMVYAVNEALKQVINMVRPGVKTSQIGEVVQKTAQRYGLKPIWNLTGHQLSKYVLHTGKPIPNVPRFDFARINAGEVFAIEPFFTLSSGKGEIRSGTDSYIFRLQRERGVKSPTAKDLMDKIKENFKTLPFSKRWLNGFMPKSELDAAFKELLSAKNLMDYPILIEAAGKTVVQAEHTVIVTDDGRIVTTQ